MHRRGQRHACRYGSAAVDVQRERREYRIVFKLQAARARAQVFAWFRADIAPLGAVKAAQPAATGGNDANRRPVFLRGADEVFGLNPIRPGLLEGAEDCTLCARRDQVRIDQTFSKFGMRCHLIRHTSLPEKLGQGMKLTYV